MAEPSVSTVERRESTVDSDGNEPGIGRRLLMSNGTWTFAILVAMGTLLVSWQQLVASFNPGYIMICTTTVLAMIGSGFVVGKWLNMYPIEAAIVTACHSGLGGTGDVAILGAADRMGLMAFAQIATRVGGAIMIVIATLLMKSLS